MTPIAAGTPTPHTDYPDSDGLPTSDNTLQFRWIVTIQGNLDLLFANDPTVFVAGDHLIYPVEGDNRTRQAPDVYVAFGRPKGDRGSYKVWEENGIFPQVVFEVLSPGNRHGEMARKFLFYETYGAEEYYILDPDRLTMEGYLNRPAGFTDVPDMDGWVSPRLGVRFALGADLELFYPDGRRFLTFVELGQLQAETARRAEQERTRAEQERARYEQERQRADKLAARLRELGGDPDAP
jgi:Uma2 family endonuclease